MFARLFSTIDGLLRGEATHPDAIRDGRLQISLRDLATLVLILAGLSGLGIGSYSLVRTLFGEGGTSGPGVLQAVSSAVKLPLLFFLTLFVTLPSLYVFNALIGSRLRIDSVIRLLMGMIVVTLAVLASLVPIILFFSMSTSNYLFIKLLTVVFAGIAGLLGLSFLMRTLSRLNGAMGSAAPDQGAMPAVVAETGPPPPPPLETPVTPKRPRTPYLIFSIWVIAFGLVGVQMSWLLRPFIGSPDNEFAWLRARESNFFLDMIRSIGELLGA